jgi:zinc transport system substrate-binding protein
VSRSRRPGRGSVAATATVVALLLAGCSTDDPAGVGDTVDVVAGFYPLQFVAERVGGDLVAVSNLTKPGAEPHDLELAPQDVGSVADADLALYLSGFQPAVDEAISTSAPDTGFDVTQYADLSLTFTPIDEGTAEDEEDVDPHFWLDPMRLADVADAVAERFAAVDPAHADTYSANATALHEELLELDNEMLDGLASCESRDIVTSHNAFGYLADAYDMNQIGITGLTPESEPNPQTLADVTDFVERNDVRTIYYETLVSPDIANTVAAATGARTAVLDPIEGLSDESLGDDYLDIMRANLDQLREGQPCP